MADVVYTTLKPDWVMSGVTNADGTVLVFASTKLTKGELRAVMADPDMWHLSDPIAFPSGPRPVYEIDVTMGTFVVTQGADYTEALCRLFEHWSPGPKPEISDGRRPLPTGE